MDIEASTPSDPRLAGSTAAQSGADVDAPRDAWVKRQVGRWLWRIRSDWCDFFGRDSVPDWLNLADCPHALRVKENDGREVWRYQSGSRLIFVKIGRPARRWARVRRLIFRSEAAREFRAAVYAAEHRIPTVAPIAFADAPLSGRRPSSILITAGIPDAEPLNEFWASRAAAGQLTRLLRNQVIDLVARLLARAHHEGFEHFDLHSGNVLLEPQPGGGYRAVFVDLNNVRLNRSICESVIARNLAQFNQWFRQNAPVSDRVRFLDRYLFWRDTLEAREGHGHAARCDRLRLIRSLERAVIDHANALYAKRDRRAMRSGRYFARLRLPGGWRANVFLGSKHAVPGSPVSTLKLDARDWEEWLSDPLRWLKPQDRRDLLKDSASATVCRGRLPRDAGAIDVVCKRSCARNVFKRLQNLVRPSRPMMTWRRAHALLHRQIATARPLAVVERRRGPLLVDSILITEYIPHANDLDTLLTVAMRELPAAEAIRLKSQVSYALAAVVRRLLERGFVHRDFKAPNIIVQWDRQSPPRILLIDLDGLRRSRRRAHGEIRMLMRLNVSLDHCRRVTRTDRLRFLLRYLQRIGPSAGDWKTIWRQVERVSERKRVTRSRSQEKKFRKYGRF